MAKTLRAQKPSPAILYALMFGPFFPMFDSGMVKVGLPVIVREFGTGMQAVQWTAAIHLLTMSALLPSSAHLPMHGAGGVCTISASSLYPSSPSSAASRRTCLC